MMRTKWLSICVFMCALMIGGCATSYESGQYDRDDISAYPGTEEGGPSSLFEMSFGGGEAEVTKNLPGDAAGRVGDAVKSIRGKSEPDVSGQ